MKKIVIEYHQSFKGKSEVQEEVPPLCELLNQSKK